MSDPDSPFQRRPVRLGSSDHPVEWGIAAEVPVEVRLNGAAWTVMLATPTDLEDLAIGLALTERLVSVSSSIQSVQKSSAFGEFTVDLSIPPALLSAPAATRSLAGNSGCGLCGLESLAAMHSRHADSPGNNRDDRAITDSAILRAFGELDTRQPINDATHSVHAAAWCRLDGSVELVREDVGRHNALDKLVGALSTRGSLGTEGFIAMTSRCSYELVSKAAVAGAHLLATISAPTTLALTWSESLGVPLACLGPGRSVVRFPEVNAHAAG